METIPTLKEFLKKKAEELRSDFDDVPLWVITASLEHEKLHVKAAQEAVVNMGIDRKGCEMESGHARGCGAYLDEDKVYASYPLTNII